MPEILEWPWLSEAVDDLPIVEIVASSLGNLGAAGSERARPHYGHVGVWCAGRSDITGVINPNVSRLLFLFGSESPNNRGVDLVNVAEAVTGVVNLFRQFFVSERFG